jgi:hypothetical protein
MTGRQQPTASSCTHGSTRRRRGACLVVYPGATHVFDVDAPPRRNEYGKNLAYDPDASRDAARRVEGFLHEIVR